MATTLPALPASLQTYAAQQAEPLIQEVEARAKAAAAAGAKEAVLPWIAASLGLSVLAILISFARRR